MKTTNLLTEFEANSLQTEGEDVINFARPLAITDDSRQWNMTKYDIDSLDISTYDGTVTADHGQTISDVIGKVVNLRKEGNKVLIDGIKFAIKENPLAVLAKNLMKGGFVTGVSIETIGEDADDTLTWKNHKLAGLSIVAHPNNRNAYAIIANSIQEAKEYGLQTNNLELLEAEKSIYFSDEKDYNITMNKGNPYHGKDGKFTSAPGGSSISFAKERYEKAKTLYENIDRQRKGSAEEKEMIEAKAEYRKSLQSEISSKRAEIDEAQQEYENLYWEAKRFDKLSEEYEAQGNGTEMILADEEAERIRTVDMKAASDKTEKLESEYSALKKELRQLDETPVQKFEREKDENTPIATTAPKELSKETQEKIKSIMKKFGNSVSKQVKENSNRLDLILNEGKGNPYHDKLGRFTSGPSTAFGMFARNSEFRHIKESTPKSAARSIGLPTSGPNDIVMTSMTDEQLIAVYDCEIATIGVENFNRNADSTHEEAPKELLSLNDRIANNAATIYEETKKFVRGTAGEKKGTRESEMKSALNVIKKMTDDSQKCADLASKINVPESEDYAKRLVVEGNDALQAVRATLSYISKNTEDKVRTFATK